ncbi:hypothetical protein WMW72_25370 [Paenibacillus filicis]|uniref:Tail fiber protein n=1 Tax=Paenibacillus filicis TaxID=669464 RepID=A0ABU9DQW3_9BACL
MAYPSEIDRFSDKLNKRSDGGAYIIEEELRTSGGKYEGPLAHDNIVNSSIQVYTGSRFTGEPVTNFVVSVPAETPWRRMLRAFSTAPVLYVTYETPGDTVEADDINVLQTSLTATQTEMDRYKKANDSRVLSAEDRLASVESVKANKTYVDTELTTKADKAATYTKTETDQRIKAVVGAAPEALDTLQELGAALNNDPNFAANVTNQLATKVDKIAGKQLSTEDFTTAEKTKLAGVAAGANAYVHPSNHPPSIIVQDANNRFVTDAEKASWTAKASTAAATPSASGLMSAADKAKLDGVAAGANAYVHPTGDGNLHVPATGTSNGGKVLKAGATAGSAAWGMVDWAEVAGKPALFTPEAHTHTADEVAESTSKRFVTDAEKASWTAKASTAAATPSVSGLMSAADKAKLDGIAAGGNNYVHPTGDGNQHVPATGTTNNAKVLKAGATAGSAAWGLVDWAEMIGKPTAFTPATHEHPRVQRTDDRTIKPSATPRGFLGLYFTSLGGLNGATGDSQYQDMVVLNTYTDTSGGKVNALVFNKSTMKILHYQAAQGDGVWGAPRELAYAGDAMPKGPVTWNQLKGV